MSSNRNLARRLRFSLGLATWSLAVLLVVSAAVAAIGMSLLDRSMARAWSIEHDGVRTRWIEGEGVQAREVVREHARSRATPSPEVRAMVREHFLRTLPQLVAPVLALGLAGAVLLTHRALRPVQEVTDNVRRILETGALDARVALPRRPGPLWELAVLFNGMLDRIESLMAGLRESLDHLAHDLRTPLTRVCVRVERALQHETEPERLRETLSDCLEDVREVLAMLDALLDLAEAESGSLRLEREAVPLDEVLARVLELYEFVAEDRHVTLHTELEPGLRVCADRARLRQILANLVDNAIKYSRPEGGEVRIRARREGERVVIEVRDRGLGIRAEDLPRIWERLYRADRSRSERGLGLGLSLVRALVTALGGDVEVESEVGRGTTFRLRLPAA